MVGKGGGEEAVEGDTARVGDGDGEQAGHPNPHPPTGFDSLLTTSFMIRPRLVVVQRVALLLLHSNTRRD